SGTNSVSAGIGPLASMPAARAAAITGAMTSASSWPRWPDSPLWGLRPATRMRGRAMRKRRRRSASSTRSVLPSDSPVIARGTCSTRGAPARSERSPITTRWAPRASRAMRTQSSGPTPAGSPEVSAMSGLAFVKPQLDVGLVAQLPQPFLVRLVGLALAQRLPGLQALALGGKIARAPLEHLDQVIAEGRAHGLADLGHFQLLIGALELGHRVARIDPVELAAARRGAIVGIGARELGEIGATAHDAFAQVEKLAARLGLGDRLVRTDEDVPQARLHDW